MKNSMGVFKKSMLSTPSLPPCFFFFWNSPMQVGSVPCDQKFSCNWNLSFFKAVPSNKFSFYLDSLVHIISSLSSHFRSWDYPENFGIYSQLDRKSKTWFFTFPNVYVSWMEHDKILISQISPPKSRCFADQSRPKREPHENEQLGFEKRMKKMGLLVSFSYFILELWSLNYQKLLFFLQFFADVSKKFKAAVAIYVYASEISCFAYLKMVLVIMLWLRI